MVSKEMGLVTLVEGAFPFRNEQRANTHVTMTAPDTRQKVETLHVLSGDHNGLVPQVIHKGISAHGHHTVSFEDDGEGLVMADNDRFRKTGAHRGTYGNHTKNNGYDHLSHSCHVTMTCH